jgi:hypothetical protein
VVPTLTGCEDKLRWGQKHLKLLRDEIASLAKSDLYKLRAERNDSASEYIFRIKAVPRPPDHWGLLFGDGVHNLRSALDHLIVQLAVLGQQRDLTDAEMQSCQFPVVSRPEDWNRNERKIALLRSGEQTRIRELQPFTTSDLSIWGTGSGTTRGFPAPFPMLLRRLHDIDITDKHRFVHPTWEAITNPGPLPDLPGLKSGSTTADSLVLDAEVGRWFFDGPLPDLPDNMDVESYFPIGVAFEKPTFFNPLAELSERLELAVGQILELFRPSIESGDPPLPVTTMSWVGVAAFSV